jgi:mRNA interferase MazF
MELKQYDVVLVNLDPSLGSEMKKTRPCIIISPNEMNKYLQTIVIAPITSSSKPYPTRIEIRLKKTKGWIVLDQIRTIDRQRITKIIEPIPAKEVPSIKAIIREIFVD